MGSKQLRCRQGNGHFNICNTLNSNSLSDLTLEDLKTFTIKGIQFGINPLVDSIVIGENNDDPKNNYSTPPVIGFHNGIAGVIVDLLGIGKNNCVHCFCFLEVEELVENDEGIIIEFGEYKYGHPNDFNEKLFIIVKKEV